MAKENSHKSILDLTHQEANDFFFKQDSYYCEKDLPPYFNFSDLLTLLKSWNSDDISSKDYRRAGDFDGVNYTLLTNKDGHFGWRPIKLINPFFYSLLVLKITSEEDWNVLLGRLSELRNRVEDKITCESLPVISMSKRSDKEEQITQWLDGIEKRSVSMALDWEFIANTDITNCYADLYTHNIPRAIHSKERARKKSVTS